MAAFTMSDRQELKKNAREKLKGNLLMPFLAVLIVSLITGALNSGYVIKNSDGTVSAVGSISSLVDVIISGFLSFGLASYFLKFIRSGKTELESLFDGTKNIGACIIAGLLSSVIIAVGFILLIVPGIIAALRLSMTFYILVDNPDMSATDAMKRSNELMKGRCGELFMMHLSFILWYLGVAVTAGILYIYVGPYVATALAMYYDKIKPVAEETVNDESVSSDDLLAYKEEKETPADDEEANDVFDDEIDDEQKGDNDIIL